MNYEFGIRLRITALLFVLFAVLKAETIHFTIDYMGLSVANIRFENERLEEGSLLTVNASSTRLSSVFAISFDNVYEILSDSLFLPVVYSKNIDQRNFKEISQTMYCFMELEADFHDTVSGKRHNYRINDDTRDIFTALFYMRTLDLRENISFSIDAAGKMWTITSRFLGTEQLRTTIGSFMTNRVEISFEQYDDTRGLRSDILTNNLVNEDNRLIFWFTDDERQIPVRASYNMRPFNVNWTIRNYEL
jgi:hypothetical protein